jgi:hypothetical protein
LLRIYASDIDLIEVEDKEEEEEAEEEEEEEEDALIAVDPCVGVSVLPFFDPSILIAVL